MNAVLYWETIRMNEINFSAGESALSQFDLLPEFTFYEPDKLDNDQNPEANAHINHLVARSQDGDQDAFALLYKEFVGPVYRYTYLRIGRVDPTEDLTQEVFLKAFHNIRSFSFQGKPFISWLFRIAHNLIIDHYRQTKRSKSIPLIESFIDTADDPAVAAEQHQEIYAVKQAIEELPPREKEIISLRFGADLSIIETAQVTGISEGSVKKLQHEGITKLRNKLERGKHEMEVKVNGLFLDYDGTISPLDVPRQQSRVPPHLEILLNTIRKSIPVCVITAKDLPFILPRTTFAQAWGAIAGLEMKAGSQLFSPEGVNAALPPLNEALAYAKQNIKYGGVIEEKCDSTGRALAFCVDWREVRDKKEAKIMSDQVFAYCKSLQLKVVKYPGKPYFDVFAYSTNKGRAVKQIRNTLKLSGNILYMGDSVADNSAFKAANISIGVTGGKKPSDLDCQYWIKFEDVPYFLGFLFKNNFTFSPDLPGIRILEN